MKNKWKQLPQRKRLCVDGGRWKRGPGAVGERCGAKRGASCQERGPPEVRGRPGAAADRPGADLRGGHTTRETPAGGPAWKLQAVNGVL